MEARYVAIARLSFYYAEVNWRATGKVLPRRNLRSRGFMFCRIQQGPRLWAYNSLSQLSLSFRRPRLSYSTASMTVNLSDDHASWHVAGQATNHVHSVYTKPIQQSQQDDRQYRLIRLNNGLQAMLVHDPKADKAAASLDVTVGHLYDPVSCLPAYSAPQHASTAWRHSACIVRSVRTCAV